MAAAVGGLAGFGHGPTEIGVGNVVSKQQL